MKSDHSGVPLGSAACYGAFQDLPGTWIGVAAV